MGYFRNIGLVSLMDSDQELIFQVKTFLPRTHHIPIMIRGSLFQFKSAKWHICQHQCLEFGQHFW